MKDLVIKNAKISTVRSDRSFSVAKGFSKRFYLNIQISDEVNFRILDEGTGCLLKILCDPVGELYIELTSLGMFSVGILKGQKIASLLTYDNGNPGLSTDDGQDMGRYSGPYHPKEKGYEVSPLHNVKSREYNKKCEENKE